MKTFNLSRWALEHKSFVVYLMLLVLHARGLLGPGDRAHPRSKLDEVVVTDTIPLADDGADVHEDAPALGRVPVRRDDPAHFRRRVGHLPLRGAEQQFLSDAARRPSNRRLRREACRGPRRPSPESLVAGLHLWSRHEIRRLRAHAAGDRSEPPPAQCAKGSRHRLRRRHAGHDRARSQRPLLRAEEGSLPLVAARDGARRQDRAGPAARLPDAPVQADRACTSTSSASTPTTKITKKVPLHFVNEENSPAVKTDGCVVNHVVNELRIQCLASQLPEFIDRRPRQPDQGPVAARQRHQAARGHQGRDARQAEPGDRLGEVQAAEGGSVAAPVAGRRRRRAGPTKARRSEKQNKK